MLIFFLEIQCFGFSPWANYEFILKTQESRVFSPFGCPKVDGAKWEFFGAGGQGVKADKCTLGLSQESSVYGILVVFEVRNFHCVHK
jgi:hypothetical protein